MGRVIAVMSISLDGFIEGPDQDISWHRVDEQLHQAFNDYLSTMGVWLYGRRVYDLMEDYWPTADQEPDAPSQILEYARLWKTMPKVVFSTTLVPTDPTVGVMRHVDADEIEALKAVTEGDLALGGAEITDAFAQLGLVDEYRLYIHPVAIGEGTPYFASPVDLELLETHVFDNGVVMVRYRPV